MNRQSTAPSWWKAVERPVFIVGAERSGTTLLRSLLSAHSSFAVAPETHFMRLADAFGAHERDAPADFEAFWRALAAHLDRRAIRIDLARARCLIEEDNARDFRGVFAALLAATCERAGKRRAGEKTPGHQHFLARLLEWFPEAKMVFIHRDPRACAASVLRAPWVKAQLDPRRLAAPLTRRTRACHIAHKAEEWRTSYRIENTHRGDARILSVAYEDLVTSPEDTLTCLCAKLGEAFEPAMLAERQPALIDTSKADLHWPAWTEAHERRAGAPVAPDRLTSWREELTHLEIAMLEGVCAEGMAALGYAPDVPPSAQQQGRRHFTQLLWADRIERSSRKMLQALLKPARQAGSLAAAISADPLLTAIAATL